MSEKNTQGNIPESETKAPMTRAELKALAQAAGAAKEPWYSSRAFIHDTATHADAKFIAACTPATIAALVECAKALEQLAQGAMLVPQISYEILKGLIEERENIAREALAELERVMGGE